MEFDCDGFYNGNGGDSIFCKLNTAGPVSDALLSHGLGRQTFRATLDLAQLHGVTVWEAVGLALKKALRLPRLTTPCLDGLSWDARCLPVPRSMWQKGMSGCLPGKIDHVRSILGSLRPAPAARERAAPEIFQPLVSQPVIETCLRIPTWLWIEGRQDRAVVRHAFSDILPSDIVARRSKGDFSALNQSIAERLYSQVRSTLLDGWLIREGLLDRADIERRLSLPVAEHGRGFHRLLQLAQADMWSRRILALRT
ncbi:MAG: asparagine synthase-related protein [Asticcacaulis sp.]|uniref:asparagine synthase-related protein n=1 Tax=Asticcacaulis sp. TaxID=1872648 RepID=UPI003F7BAE0D